MNEIKRQVKLRKMADNLKQLSLGDTPLDSLNYVARFWTVSPGQRVLNDSYEVEYVVSADPDYPEQIHLSSDRIGYLQDLFWYPTEEERNGFLAGVGAVVTPDSVLFKRAFYPLPKDLAEYCYLVSQLRLREINSGGKDFVV